MWKGHAKQHMVQEGAVRQCDRDGNDKADEITYEGVELHSAVVDEFSSP